MGWSINDVVVVDDATDFRDSLQRLLRARQWRVHAFASSDEFLGIADRLPPAILLLDIRVADCDGLELLERNGLDSFATIMMTGHGDVPSAVRAFKGGAVDFLEKPFTAAALFDALERASGLLSSKLQESGRRKDAESKLARLSGRELQVLRRLLGGGSNKSVARTLGISSRTVELHRARMMDKLGVRTAAELAYVAVLGGVDVRVETLH